MVKSEYISQLTPPEPHTNHTEQALLGGLLIDHTAWDDIADQISERDFFRAEHRVIFRGIARLIGEGTPADIVTLREWLTQMHMIDQAGGMEYLTDLVRDSIATSHLSSYAKTIRDYSIRRQLLEAARKIGEMAYRMDGQGIQDLLDQAEQQIFKIADQTKRRDVGVRHVDHYLAKAIDRIEALHEQGSALMGVPSGFLDLDKKLSGLQRSDLIIVAGRPSMGKTSFAMNIAENIAIGSNQPVLIFSMEMPGEQLALRSLASLSSVDQHILRTAQLNERDWNKISSSIALLNGSQLFIDDTPALSPTDLRARARRLKREKGDLGLIVIDYLQLMKVSGSSENRATEVSEISRSLKSLARELDVPVVALSQLNRGLEQRPNKRPLMSDLRESGAIEQDADIIIFIYRDEVYDQESQDKGTAEIIVAKQRNGPIGTVRLTFSSHTTRFENYAGGYEDPGF